MTVALISSFLDLRVAEILGLSLVLMAAISAGGLAFSSEGRFNISLKEDHVRIFKAEESAVSMGMESQGSPWTGLRVISCSMGDVPASTAQVGDDKVRLSFAGKYAARSRGLRVRFAKSDRLGLLQIESEVARPDIVLDVLPRSLIALEVSRTVPTTGYGERPARYPGQGQEVYALDYYHPSTDAKDIVWKRVAKSPDEMLVERVREANIKDSLNLGVLQLAERAGEERQRWIDALCEALASMGKEVVKMGVKLTVLYRSEGSLVAKSVSDLRELAEVVMDCSTAPASPDVAEVVRRSELLVTGLLELDSGRLGPALPARPVILIPESSSPRSSPATFGKRAVVYSGRDNFLPLLRRVLEK